VRDPPSLLGLGAHRVARPDGTLEPGVVWIDVGAGTIAAVEARPAAGAATSPTAARPRWVELGDRTVAPGFVDVHVHGGSGAQVNAASPGEVADALDRMARFHVRHGTTAFLATTVSDSPERLAATVEGVAQAARAGRSTDEGPGTARVLGSHLEGPFISPARAGAQDPGGIRLPDRAELNRLLELGAGTVKLVTIAPELPGAFELVADCLDAGASVSFGHTDCDYDTALRAIDAGVTHVTHLFNAMAPLHHRRPGPATAALLDPGVTLELVCDLHHVHPAVVELVAGIARSRLVLVTDAGGAAGLPPGRHLLGSREVVLEDTKVTLASDPGTLAGSVLTMDAAVANCVTAAGMPLPDALEAASATALRAVGPGGGAVGAGLGSLVPGAPADVVVLDSALVPVVTVVAAEVVYDPGGLLA
jgi:N-acetylglucosamine-6-phosphate deacetylase